MSDFICKETFGHWFSIQVNAFHCQFRLENFEESLFSRYDIPVYQSLAKAVKKRRAEFLAGRYCAGKALTRLGFDNVNVGIGENRSPVWPEGVLGSISHNGSMAVAIVAVAGDYMGIGIDIEDVPSQKTVNDILSHVITDNELHVLQKAGFTRETLFTIAFSMKESFFKAAYPDVGRYFDFSAVSIVDISPENKTLTLELKQDLSEFFYEKRRVKGEFSILDNGMVATAIAI